MCDDVVQLNDAIIESTRKAIEEKITGTVANVVAFEGLLTAEIRGDNGMRFIHLVAPGQHLSVGQRVRFFGKPPAAAIRYENTPAGMPNLGVRQAVDLELI